MTLLCKIHPSSLLTASFVRKITVYFGDIETIKMQIRFRSIFHTDIHLYLNHKCKEMDQFRGGLNSKKGRPFSLRLLFVCVCVYVCVCLCVRLFFVGPVID